jgi:maltose O-acetyltransferase
MILKAAKRAVAHFRDKFDKKREQMRWARLRELGMHIGNDVFLPMSLWVDVSHCYLISIGDRCRFAPNCAIFAHDAIANEFIDAGKIGKVILHESCCFGYGTIILPGVEIGPRVITSAGSVISTTIPPDSMVAGNPAQVVGKLSDYIRFQKLCLKKYPVFPYLEFGLDNLPVAKREEMLKTLKDANAPFGYITGGYQYEERYSSEPEKDKDSNR